MMAECTEVGSAHDGIGAAPRDAELLDLGLEQAAGGRLSLLGLDMLWIWPGAGGITVTVIYILLGNLPFIIIQRYNRPRLQRLYAMQQRKRDRSSI